MATGKLCQLNTSQPDLHIVRSEIPPDSPLNQEWIQRQPRLQTHTFCMGEIF